jgi:predicted metal-dependent TIM-barrel fold hydrolase
MSRLFDPHIHMDSRNAADYELMALAGVERMVNPCSFSGERRYDGRAFGERFDRLLGFERARARHFGIDLMVGLAVNANDIGDAQGAAGGLREMERRLNDPALRPAVAAVGELALRRFDDTETGAFRDQLALAAAFDLPVVVETPPGREAFAKLAAVVEDALATGAIRPERLCLVDLDADKLERLHPLGLGGYGIAVSPQVDGIFAIHRKLDHRAVLDILERWGAEALQLCSGLHFGFADSLCLPRTALRLRLAGVPAETLERLTRRHAEEFFDVRPS